MSRFARLGRSFIGRSRTTVFARRCASSSSKWSHVEMGPKDPILSVAEAFKASKSSQKINVGIGAYRDDAGKPVVLPSVQKAEARVLAAPGYNHEYAPITGIPELIPYSQKLAFGESFSGGDTMVTAQSLSGTGSLRALGDFVVNHWAGDKLPTVHLPSPTWGAHPAIFNRAGLQVANYPYYNPENCGLNFPALAEHMKKIPENDIILFHATAHNPTGVDPTPEQWDELCDIVKKRGNLVLFDMAYQGFASGDCDRDAYSLRKFYSEGVPLMLAQSFAKNFGLYGQRGGAASIVCSSPDEKTKVESQFKRVLRCAWSNPPLHGGRIVLEILKDPVLKKEWLNDVKEMSHRIIDMRTLLRSSLEEQTGKNWQHITDQIGMFAYTGLNEAQCDELTAKHEIYLTKNGRISMAGVNTSNVKYLAESIAAVSK